MVSSGELGLGTNEILEGLSPLVMDKLGPLVTIFKAVGIALLVYVVFLIIRALFRWRTMSKLVKIAKSVQEINEKLDLLVKKTGVKIQKETIGKPRKEKKEREKKKKGKK